ncbi:MAG: hypothetical protein JO001_20180 [Alphaproteobacteria bacterium]|nr:hypothetical protein [Alphaproteobacteria bacterium]
MILPRHFLLVSALGLLCAGCSGQYHWYQINPHTEYEREEAQHQGLITNATECIQQHAPDKYGDLSEQIAKHSYIAVKGSGREAEMNDVQTCMSQRGYRQVYQPNPLVP